MEGQRRGAGGEAKVETEGSAVAVGQPLSALLLHLLVVLGHPGAAQEKVSVASKTSLPVQTRKYQSGCHDRVWPRDLRGLRGLRGLGEGRRGLGDPA